MQWSAVKNAGFTDGEPWLPIAEDYPLLNVEVERDDPGSMLTLYKQLIDLRRGEPALEVGRFELMQAKDDILVYVRQGGESVFLIALNFRAKPQTIEISQRAAAARILLSTHLDRAGEYASGSLALRGEEGLLVRLL